MLRMRNGGSSCEIILKTMLAEKEHSLGNFVGKEHI